MKNLQLLPALPIDAAVLTQISFISKRHWGYPEEWIENWRDTLTVKAEYVQKNQVYKLVKGEEVIGFCAIEVLTTFYEVAHLWLLPAHIGRGLGAFLLNETLRVVVPEEQVVRVVADPNAELFYQRQGFRRITQVESYPKGRFLPVLEKVYLIRQEHNQEFVQPTR